MLLANALIVFALILLNGFFAMSELAVVSSKKSRLEQRAKERRRGAKAALRLAENPTTFLSTVQIGITLVGIFAGAYGGSVFAEPLAYVLADMPVVGPYAPDVAFVLVVVAITYLSLIFGELVPKRIALTAPEATAAFAAPVMRLISKIGAPVVWLLDISTKSVIALLGFDKDKDEAVTEEDVKAMIAEGAQTGVFKQKEREMLEGVIKIADRTVRSIMVPRPDVDWLDSADTVETSFEEISKAGHSRFPVVDTDEDAVLGVVQVKDLFEQQHRTGKVDVKAAMREPLYVNEAMPILKLLERFRAADLHLAIVLDEYGSFEGIVTPQDILKAIAGSLPEGEEEPKVFKRPDGSYLVDGSMAVDVLSSHIGNIEFPEDRDYETVAGFVLESIGHIPTAGERFQAGAYEFEVVDMDGHRIDKLLVMPIQLEPEDEEDDED